MHAERVRPRRRLRLVPPLIALCVLSCARSEERAPVSCPPSAPATAHANALVLTVRPASYVFVTGGLGYDPVANDRYVRPRDPKPGEPLLIVRLACVVDGLPMQEHHYACEPAIRSTTREGAMFDARAHECFDVHERAATADEAATVTRALNTRKSIEVERGTIYAMEMKHVPWPRGAAPYPEVEFEGYAHDRLTVSMPFPAMPVEWVDISPEQASVEAQKPMVRIAMRFDAVVDAVRSTDRTKIDAALKLLENDLRRFRQDDLGAIGAMVDRNLPTLRALATGRANVFDPCKVRR